MLKRGRNIWYSFFTYFSSGLIQVCFLLASASDTGKSTCHQRWRQFSSFLWWLIVPSVIWKEFRMSSLSEIDPPNALYHLEHFIWSWTHPAEWVTNRISCLVGWPRYSWVSRQQFEIWCVEQPISNILNHIRPLLYSFHPHPSSCHFLSFSLDLNTSLVSFWYSKAFICLGPGVSSWYYLMWLVYFIGIILFLWDFHPPSHLPPTLLTWGAAL